MSVAVVLAGLLLVAAAWVWAPRPGPDGPEPPTAEAVAQPGQTGQTGQTGQPPGSGEVADAMELLAVALRSGAAVVDCLELAAAEQPPALAEALTQVATALRWGVDTSVAWASVDPVWAPAGAALTLAERAGVPPAELLLDAARQVRTAEQHRLELAGARLGVRIVLPLGLCFLPGFVLLTIVPLVVALTGSLLGSGLR